MYAVVETGGKQYRVEEGRTLKVERLGAEPGTFVTLERVLLVADGQAARVGSPVLEGARVPARVMGPGKTKKIMVMKYKSKVHYGHETGHAQQFETLRLDKIATS